MKLLLRLIFASYAVTALAGCGMCGNEVVQSVASPSTHLKAVVFIRDCGATTDFSTQVSIIPASKTLSNSIGNTLVVKGKVPLHVKWVSNTKLRLTGYGSAKVYKQKASVAGISVSYGG